MAASPTGAVLNCRASSGEPWTCPKEKRDGAGMDGVSPDQQVLLDQLAELRRQHEALNAEVDALTENGVVDQLKVARLKKEKLRLKDEIARIEDQITPDIIA
jgi:hypothetical protein